MTLFFSLDVLASVSMPSMGPKDPKYVLKQKKCSNSNFLNFKMVKKKFKNTSFLGRKFLGLQPKKIIRPIAISSVLTH